MSKKLPVAPTAAEIFEQKLKSRGVEVPHDYAYEDHMFYEFFEPQDELDYITVKVFHTGKTSIQYYNDELEITREIDFDELVRRAKDWQKETKSTPYNN